VALKAIDSRELLIFALNAARAAGEYTLRHFRTGVSVETKADDTPVTIADRGAEELLRARIEKHYPDHGILGEEFGEKAGREPGRWILDPIDGTYSFIQGVPLYCNLVGFEWEGEMVLGVINVPAINECVFAARGLGCFWNDWDTPARVSNVDTLSQARLTTTTARLIERQGKFAAYKRLLDACKTDRGWPDAYGYLMVATGRAEIMLDSIMSLWDIAPLAPVITEAGGTLTDWSGNPTHTATECVATNGKLLPAVLARLAGAR
jgi:histidinol phosphatase-like enzyme (inositol monophosphatase family)